MQDGLGQHHLFQHLGQRVAVRIGVMRGGFCHRAVLPVKEMTDTGITAQKDKLLGRRADPKHLQQPKLAFDGNVHHGLGNFLAGRQMNDMRDTRHRALYIGAVG